MNADEANHGIIGMDKGPKVGPAVY
jgi:hypothetical protein